MGYSHVSDNDEHIPTSTANDRRPKSAGCDGTSRVSPPEPIASDQSVSADSPSLPWTGSKTVSQRPALKHVFWAPPVAIIGLLALGIVTAFGHHFYLKSLDYKPSSDQVWVTRLPLLLAFAVKASFTVSMDIALSQCMWFSMQHQSRGVSIDTINALFTVDTSLLSFFCVRIRSSTFLVTVLGVFIRSIVSYHADEMKVC